MMMVRSSACLFLILGVSNDSTHTKHIINNHVYRCASGIHVVFLSAAISPMISVVVHKAGCGRCLG